MSFVAETTYPDRPCNFAKGLWMQEIAPGRYVFYVELEYDLAALQRVAARYAAEGREFVVVDELFPNNS